MTDYELPRDLPRNLAYERLITSIAASRVGSHGAALTAFAEERAEPGPVRDALTRDFLLEQREEAADWRNYCIWAIRQLDETRRQDPNARAARAELMATLGAVSIAYDHLAAVAALLDLPEGAAA